MRHSDYKPVETLLTHYNRLPYDLVLPLARFVAREESITRLKRWNISPVYREDRMGGVSISDKNLRWSLLY